MSRLHSQQHPRLVERRDAVLEGAKRAEQLADFYKRLSDEAAAAADYQTACHYLELALELQASAQRRYHAIAGLILEATGYRLTPRPHATTTAARMRDSRGRYVRRDGKRRPRERRDGARSSSRSGDSGSDDSGPEPEHSRPCGCDHPLVLADESVRPVVVPLSHVRPRTELRGGRVMSGHRRPTQAQVDHTSAAAAALVRRLAERFHGERREMFRDLAGWVQRELAELGQAALERDRGAR